MAPTAQKIIEYLETIDTDYKDCRVVTQLEMRSLVWFLHYGENVYSQTGRHWTGCSFSQQETTCRLCARSTYDGIPQVAFVTGRNPTDCVVIFCKKWHADTLEWYADKYR